MRASACLPDGLGHPVHGAPSPYALRVEKAPQRTQKRICAGGCVAASTCPLLTMASAASEALGPAQGSHAIAWVISGLIDIFKQVLHRQKPEEKTQSCDPSIDTLAPSRALGGRFIRSAGIGGNTCVTLAMVLTTILDLFSAASRSATWDGDGWGCMSAASFAARSATPLSSASRRSLGSTIASGFRWALTFRTAVRLLQPSSPSASRMMPP